MEMEIVNTAMYVCFEANHTEKQHAYLIYSVESGQLQAVPDSPPKFKLEHIIFGVPSMGCGIFGSKIVLAGGLVQDKYGRDKKNKGVITYDISSKQSSIEEIPKMRGGKVKPLVFELHNKLYVLDTNADLHCRSFEIYYPNQRHWHCLRNPYSSFSSSFVEQISLSKGLGRFSWFVFGKCLCLSLPRDLQAYLHHSKYRHKVFNPCFDKPLQFQGMAITYYQEGFEDVVVISFSEGLVQGHRLRISYEDPYDKPVLLFDTKEYFKDDGDKCGFFTNFGNGKFCLAAYDKDNITFYTFDISRSGNSRNGELSLNASNIFVQRRSLIQFAVQGHTRLTIAGCFASSQDVQSKENTVAELYSRDLPLWKNEQGDDDILGSKCVHHSDGDGDTDSDADDPDYELTLKREAAYLKLKLGSSTTFG